MALRLRMARCCSLRVRRCIGQAATSQRVPSYSFHAHGVERNACLGVLAYTTLKDSATELAVTKSVPIIALKTKSESITIKFQTSSERDRVFTLLSELQKLMRNI